MNTGSDENEMYRKWFDSLSDEKRWRLRNDLPEIYEKCESGEFDKCKDLLDLCIKGSNYYDLKKMNAF